MTATLTPLFERVDTQSVTTTLSLVHDQWMERTARLLAPATQPRANFWERWGAVRFLCDQFAARFRLERELAESLAPRLTPSSRARLAAAAAAVERTRGEFMAVGRRRGTAAEVALLARRLLDHTRRWCAALEIATAGTLAEDLSEESRTLLGQLQMAAGLGL
ncbi:MAG TPA: hypothetical protein VMN37_12820 [Gemmatimonadales bacterium]|nr:hypothetical protein [Gemmatimonadales bacterium]